MTLGCSGLKVATSFESRDGILTPATGVVEIFNLTHGKLSLGQYSVGRGTGFCRVGLCSGD